MIFTIDPDSPVPKYKQIINLVTQAVKSGMLRQDEQLPSINEMSESNYLARDTVEKAYNELKATLLSRPQPINSRSYSS
jgi:DNA-binding transcriptional regulator YhcF (GntR family)